jgi:hypothetical protein
MCSEPISKHQKKKQKELDYLICKVNKLILKIAFHMASKEVVDERPYILLGCVCGNWNQPM